MHLPSSRPRAASLLGWCVGLALVAPGATAKDAGEDARANAVDAIFHDVDRRDSPGCNVAVVEADKPILAKSYGMADVSLGVPMRSSTSHWIPYSEARVFVALAIAMLARDGKFSLDDPIRKHVPEVPDYARAVTVRQLLHHTSGLADYGTLAGPGFQLPDRLSEDEFFRILTRWNKLVAEPGRERMYSNTDYALLRILVERAGGVSLDAYLKAQLFAPLGMASTRVGADQGDVAPGHALFHEDTGDGYRRLLGYRVSPVGGIAVTTSMDDLLRWDRALRDPARGLGRLLGQLEAGAPASADAGEASFAFGVHRRRVDGREVLEYRGIGGYVYLVQSPERSVAVLCNQYAGMATRASRVMALYEGKPSPAGASAQAPSASVAATPAVTLTPAELQAYAGEYRDPSGVPRVDVTVADGQLAVTPRGRPGFPGVVPLGQGRFATATPYELSFAPGADGVLTLASRDTATGEPGGEPLRRAVIAPPTVEVARAYAGTYVGDQVEVVLHVRADGQVVRMAARGMPEAVITPEPAPDTFRLPEAYTARFERDEAGRVIGLVLDANRVKGMRFSRSAQVSPVKPGAAAD